MLIWSLNVNRLIFVLLFFPALSWACPDPLPEDTICLGWQPPAQDVDGNPITTADLSGYRIYLDDQPIPDTADLSTLAVIAVDDPLAVEHIPPTDALESFRPARGGQVELYARMTALDDEPSESGLSNQRGPIPVLFSIPDPGPPTLIEVLISTEPR